jgi:putative ABC transport system ATP-binding protein
VNSLPAERIVELEQVQKSYATRNVRVLALDEISLAVDEGQWVSIEGPSGAGKTTLLLTIGGMLKPTSGVVRVLGQRIYAWKSEARARFRARNIGFVFQLFHLLPYLTVWENVWLGGRCSPEAWQRTEELLERLGLADRARHKPHQLSAGEKQRTAIARALLNRPRLILADEPTGNLDQRAANEVYRILEEYRREGGTIVLVTHGSASRALVDQTFRLNRGRLQRVVSKDQARCAGESAETGHEAGP